MSAIRSPRRRLPAVSAARRKGFRRTGRYGTSRGIAYIGLMLAATITLPHFLVSSEMSLPKSAGEPASTVPPRLASRALNFGSDLLVQSFDELCGRTLRSTNAEPCACLVARQGFAESRNVRQHGRARRGRDRQGAELAGPDISDRREQRTEIDLLHIAGEKCGKHLCAATRHVKEIEVGHGLEHFAGDMGGGSDSGRRQIELAWIGLGVGDELRNGPGRNDGWTSMTRGTRTMPATGAMSRMKSKLSLNIVALTAFAEVIRNSV